MTMRAIISILLPSVALMGCAANLEQTAQARPERAAASQQSDLRRLQTEQMRRENQALQRMNRERAAAHEREQMQRNLEGR